MTIKVYSKNPLAHHAIVAAKNMHSWGVYAATRYAINRGVSLGALQIAVKCEKEERRAAWRLPMFLVRQAF